MTSTASEQVYELNISATECVYSHLRLRLWKHQVLSARLCQENRREFDDLCSDKKHMVNDD